MSPLVPSKRSKPHKLCVRAHAASPIIPIDKESLERVRGFRKHYELLDKAKQLAVDARDELVRIKPPLLQKIQTIASVIVDKAIEHLNMDIRAIEQHQAVSKDSEKKCMDAMQITKFSEVCIALYFCFPQLEFSP